MHLPYGLVQFCCLSCLLTSNCIRNHVIAYINLRERHVHVIQHWHLTLHRSLFLLVNLSLLIFSSAMERFKVFTLCFSFANICSIFFVALVLAFRNACVAPSCTLFWYSSRYLFSLSVTKFITLSKEIKYYKSIKLSMNKGLSF